MKSDPEQIVETKYCPICSQALPLSEFGICRARKDGRNLYCKSCIRKKVTESRQVLREYKSARKRYVSQQTLEAQANDSSENFSRLISKLSPIERVREAIKKGSRTHQEIRKGSKLGDDEVGDALANLLLWTHEIRTEVVNNTRMYFINETVEADTRQTEAPPQLPRRKPDVPSSFSALQGLMPGRKPEGETEKIGGWVAA
ncbi:MAG TPA: hypothetical protein VFR80_11980 [Pyrinomonadaceae bacterium]|nr:hypothetical protein [Pyrinomonadaceae bacterium]